MMLITSASSLPMPCQVSEAVLPPARMLSSSLLPLVKARSGTMGRKKVPYILGGKDAIFQTPCQYESLLRVARSAATYNQANPLAPTPVLAAVSNR